MPRTKVTFLYSELAGYFVACVNELAKHADVLIVRWPVNSEAPFQFDIDESIKVIEKQKVGFDEIKVEITNFNPDIVVCSGWMDKDYLKLIKKLPKSCKKIISLDNHWTGSWRQRIATLIAPFYLKRLFDLAWVPGTPQQIFAEKLGFKGKVVTGFYCADSEYFNKQFETTFEEKRKDFPKRFLFAARYVEHKGVFDLWEAFNALQIEFPNEWELWCVGTGAEFENRVEHPKIKHFGFVQPADLVDVIKNTSVYILPSKFEPWGVSAQEFAICGFPLILSSEIGSGEFFLRDNGLSFKAGDVVGLKNALLKIIQLSQVELIEMGTLSHHKGMAYTTKDWANKLLGLND